MNTLYASQAYRPHLRKEIVLGPPVASGETTIYYLKDGLTGWFYRIGLKEHFLISRMNGSKTLQEIELEYAMTFKKRLDIRSWEQIFLLLNQRQLLINESDPLRLAELKQKVRKQVLRDQYRLFQWRYPLLYPDPLFGKLLPRLQFVFHPIFFCLALVAIALLEVFVVVHLKMLSGEVSQNFSRDFNGFSFLLVLVMVIGFFTLHEFAHGLACKQFGGSVQEIGLIHQYFWCIPYCKVDDIVLFHKRRQRVSTAFAGVFVNLLMLLPFAPLWQFTSPTTFIHVLSAFILLYFNILALVSLLPFAEMDGYMMLNHALNMTALRSDAYHFYFRLSEYIMHRKTCRPLAYSKWRAVIFALYGLMSFIYVLLFTAGTTWLFFILCRAWLGETISWLLLPVVLLFLLLNNADIRDWYGRRHSKKSVQQVSK